MHSGGALSSFSHSAAACAAAPASTTRCFYGCTAEATGLLCSDDGGSSCVLSEHNLRSFQVKTAITATYLPVSGPRLAATSFNKHFSTLTSIPSVGSCLSSEVDSLDNELGSMVATPDDGRGAFSSWTDTSSTASVCINEDVGRFYRKHSAAYDSCWPRCLSLKSRCQRKAKLPVANQVLLPWDM